ncbi:MAG: MlaD family protein, partial [Sandaracinaceae bacterium]|nr:MlaD family protein [Sandaracinaceae bacterium]
MRDTVKAAKVGALVLAALVGAFIVWRLVDERSSSQGGYRVWALFDNAQGLITKSRVTVAGIPVGYIDSIRLQGSKARVDMVINDDVALYDDATVSRRSASLLGEYLLAIHPGAEPERRLVDGDQIRAVIATTDTADIMQDIG